jgi:hypothetical protein
MGTLWSAWSKHFPTGTKTYWPYLRGLASTQSQNHRVCTDKISPSGLFLLKKLSYIHGKTFLGWKGTVEPNWWSSKTVKSPVSKWFFSRHRQNISIASPHFLVKKPVKLSISLIQDSGHFQYDKDAFNVFSQHCIVVISQSQNHRVGTDKISPSRLHFFWSKNPSNCQYRWFGSQDFSRMTRMLKML